VGEVFDLLKLRNIAHDVTGYAQLSPEQVVERNPDLIIALDPRAIIDTPAFKDVAAVKNGTVIALENDPLSVAGPRFVDGIEAVAKAAYPDLFP
jgi:iron complex transport system substrate-binding protein